MEQHGGADARDTHTLTAVSGDMDVATATGTRVSVTGVGPGTATITMRATDDSGASNAQPAARTFTVTVPNSRPALGPIADRSLATGEEATVDVRVTDADARDAPAVAASSADTGVATVSVAGTRLTLGAVATPVRSSPRSRTGR